MRKRVHGNVILALCALLSVHDVRAETRPGYGGTIKCGLLGEPATIDPVDARTHTDITLIALVFDTLYRIDGKHPDGTPRVLPHVASALPTVSEDGLTARVPVRTDIRLHDGALLRTTDIEQSINRAHSARTSSYLLAPVDSIQRQGDALVFSLRRPMPELAAVLTAPATSITPAGRPPHWSRVVGSGPFRLAARDRQQKRLYLIAHDRYFAGRPYIDKLYLHWFERPFEEATAYESGDTHVSLRGAVAYDDHVPKYRTRAATGPTTILSYVGFGRAGGHAQVTGDVDFRRALSLAIERDAFRSVGTGEQIAPGVHPVATAVGGPSTSASDRRARPSAARDALARAARRVRELDARADRDGDGVRDFELELIVDRARLDDQAIAGKVALALFRVGIKARVVALATDAFAERVRTGACDLYIGQLSMPAALPELALIAAFEAGGDRYAARLYGKRGIGAPRGFDTAQVDREFARRLPVVPLFHRAIRVHHRHDVLGFHFDDSSRLFYGDLFFFGRARLSK